MARIPALGSLLLLLSLLICACERQESASTPAPVAKPQKVMNPRDNEVSTSGLLPLETPARTLHFYLPQDLSLMEWRSGYDGALAAQRIGDSPNRKVATDDTIVFSRANGSSLDLMSVRFAERRSSDGFRIQSWLDSVLGEYAAKTGYQLLLRDRQDWPGQPQPDVYYKALFRYETERGPQFGDVFVFMHEDYLSLFLYEAPEEPFKALNPLFVLMMKSAASGPAHSEAGE